MRNYSLYIANKNTLKTLSPLFPPNACALVFCSSVFASMRNKIHFVQMLEHHTAIQKSDIETKYSIWLIFKMKKQYCNDKTSWWVEPGVKSPGQCFVRGSSLSSKTTKLFVALHILFESTTSKRQISISILLLLLRKGTIRPFGVYTAGGCWRMAVLTRCRAVP